MKSLLTTTVGALVFLLAASSCALFERCSTDDDRSQARATKSVTPIPEAQLAALLPEVTGFVRQTPKTETRTDGHSRLTRAFADYSKEADGKVSTFTLELTDGTHFQAVNSRLAILAHAATDVHLKQIEVKQQVGVQHFKIATERFEVLLVVGGRVLVTLEGNKDVAQQDIVAALEAIDFTKLESLVRQS
jgi:hypothetical protein